MATKKIDKQKRVDAVVEKIDAGEITEDEALDAFYEAHYGRSRPPRIPSSDMMSADDIVDFNKDYVGFSFAPDFQTRITVRHGDIEVVEETEKAVKLAGTITIGGSVYEMLSRWIPKRALIFKDEKVKGD